ncbi:hypothetical protein LIER_42739 [Lithospermum erythrorhizon]|uniref:RNase H type-1 domain-containing protein n=1 Tax=Lithospermum erythrorhizon TaxID=34254 RepID=A0AAV3NYM2_LITER
MVIACIALWAIWEGRNKNKNEDRVISKATILSRIFQQIKLLGDGGIFKPVNWRGYLHLVTSLGCNLRVQSPSLPRVVKWTKPPDGHFKLNTDGASKGNSGESGCGGILRDKEGSIIMAFGVYLGRETSIVAEMKAIQEGLHKLCIKGIRDVMVETDSQLSIQLIRSTCCNWKLRPMVNNIKDMAEICNASFNHIFREANGAADYLANQAVHQADSFELGPSTIDNHLKALVFFFCQDILPQWQAC